MVADNRTVPVIEGIRQVDEHIPYVRVQGIAAWVDAKPVVAWKVAYAVRRVADARPRVAGHVGGARQARRDRHGHGSSERVSHGIRDLHPGGARVGSKTDPAVACVQRDEELPRLEVAVKGVLL